MRSLSIPRPRRALRASAVMLGFTLAAVGVAVAHQATSASAATMCGKNVDDAIRNKLVNMGLGNLCPDADTRTTGDGKGRYNHFINAGSVFWKSSQSGAQPVIVTGAIRDKWQSLGWESSWLGWPTTDELGTPDGVGRFNLFENGAIYWTGRTGAHSVWSPFFKTWGNLGWEAGSLGYPLTDQASTPDNVGRWQQFDNGFIHWKPNIGAWASYLQPGQFWWNSGFETGPLGYPLTNVRKPPSRPQPQFPENLVLTPYDGRTIYEDFENGVVVNNPSLTSGQTYQAKPVSTTPASEVVAKVKDFIDPILAQSAKDKGKDITRRGEPTLNGAPADYTIEPSTGRVVNRQIPIKVPVRIGTPLADIRVDLFLWIEVNITPVDQGNVVAILVKYDAGVTVPAGVAQIPWVDSAASIRQQFLDALKPQQWRHNWIQKPSTTPTVVKVNKNNDVEAFVA